MPTQFSQLFSLVRKLMAWEEVRFLLKLRFYWGWGEASLRQIWGLRMETELQSPDCPARTNVPQPQVFDS